MARQVRCIHEPLKLLASFLIMIWLGATHGKYFSVSAMTIDEAIIAAATRNNQDAKLSLMPMSPSQPDVVRVELDMIFRNEDWVAMKKAARIGSRRHRRIALRKAESLWPNAEIPYQLSLQMSQDEMRNFTDALKDYQSYSCIRFRHATSTDKCYVNILNGDGCYSSVGRECGNAPQELSLRAGCRHKSTIVHELAHALGIYHEQTRPDRDDFVIVKDENIEEGKHDNFQKYTPPTVDSCGVPYDYLSVMHYGANYFSKNRQPTIVTKNDTYQSLIGNAPGLSFRDIKLVNLMYSCSEKSRCRKKVCPTEGFVGQDCQCWCPSENRDVPAVRCQGCHNYNNFCDHFVQRGMCTKKLLMDYLNDVCPRACGVCT